jgi:hypothetical protein
MRISTRRSYDLLAKHGSYVTEVCDRCGVLIHYMNRFTRRGDRGVWCSRECRDGKEAHAPGICRGCSAALNGKRKYAKYCSDVCRMRQNGQDRPNNPKTHIQNKPLTDAILTSGYGGSREAGSGA